MRKRGATKSDNQDRAMERCGDPARLATVKPPRQDTTPRARGTTTSRSAGARSIDALRVRAEQGDAEAQLNIAVMYVSGCGVLQDDVEAARWFRRAAEQGSAEAMTNLGVMCGTGRGVAQDGAEAVRWYRLAVDWWRRAAEQGDARAMTNLGIRYASGWGVRRDYVQAHMWRNLATLQLSGGDRAQSIKTRDALASLMTPEDLSEAEHLAREWHSRHPGG